MFVFSQKRAVDVKMLGIAVIFLETTKMKCMIKQFLFPKFIKSANALSISHILQTAHVLFLP